MRKISEIPIGTKFGKLTVIGLMKKIEHPERGQYRYEYVIPGMCDCGVSKDQRVHKLRYSKNQFCGECKRSNYHGMVGTRIYTIWHQMLDRCRNKKSPIYKYYGGRGIGVCEEWADFKKFYSDMKDGYADYLTLERNKNEFGYNKENCRWATLQEQARNRRNNTKVEYNGETKLICEWAEQFGISQFTISGRLRLGWTMHDAIFTPKQTNSVINFTKNKHNGIKNK